MALRYCLILSLLLGGCATNANRPSMSYEQLQSIRVSTADCSKMDSIIETMQTQLKNRGLANANPEDLLDVDRQYNASARIVIWSLRIGCNNPNRYRS